MSAQAKADARVCPYNTDLCPLRLCGEIVFQASALPVTPNRRVKFARDPDMLHYTNEGAEPYRATFRGVSVMGNHLRPPSGSPRRLCSILRSKILVSFGLLFVSTIALVSVVRTFGIPFTSFSGSYGGQRSS